MAMFSRTLRLKRKFSCSTTPIWRRNRGGHLSGVDQAHADAVDQHAPLLGAVQAVDRLDHPPKRKGAANRQVGCA